MKDELPAEECSVGGHTIFVWRADCSGFLNVLINDRVQSRSERGSFLARLGSNSGQKLDGEQQTRGSQIKLVSCERGGFIGEGSVS